MSLGPAWVLALCLGLAPGRGAAAPTDTRVVVVAMPARDDGGGARNLGDLCRETIENLWRDRSLTLTRQRSGRLSVVHVDSTIDGPADARSVLESTGADIVLWGTRCPTADSTAPFSPSGYARFAQERAAADGGAVAGATCLSVALSDPSRFRLGTPTSPEPPTPPSSLDLGALRDGDAGIAPDLVVAWHLIANDATGGPYDLLANSRVPGEDRGANPDLWNYLDGLWEQLATHRRHETLLSLGRVYSDYVDPDAALRYQEEAQALAERMEDEVRIARSRLGQAVTLANADRFEEALAVLEAIAAHSEAGDSRLAKIVARSSVMRGKCHSEMGRGDEAIVSFAEALDRIDQLEASGSSIASMRAETHYAVGVVHRRADRGREALEAFQQAVEHHREVPAHPAADLRYRRALADALWAEGQRAAARDHYREIRPRYQTLGDLAGVLHTSNRIAEGAAEREDHDAAVAEYTILLEAAAAANDRQAQIDAANELAGLWRSEKASVPMEALTRHTGDLYRQSEDPELHASGLLWIALSRDWAGDLDGAVKYAEKALAQGRSLNSPVVQLESHLALADYHDKRGEPDRQASSLDAAAALLEAEGRLLESAEAHFDAARLRSDQRRWAEALASYERARPLFEGADAPRQAAGCLYQAGQARGHLGDAEGAMADMEGALALLEVSGDEQASGRVLYDLGWLAIEHGDHGRALELCERALAAARVTDDRELLAGCHHQLGHLAYREDQLEEAARHLTRAADEYAELGLPLDQGDALDDLGTVLSKRGERAAAREARLSAADVYSVGGDRVREGTTLVAVGAAEVEDGSTTSGLDHMRRGCTLLCEAGDSSCPWNLHRWLAAAWNEGDRSQARRAAAVLAHHGDTSEVRLRARASLVRLHHPVEVGGRGLLASQIQPGSNAEATGIQEGDVIVSYDGAPAVDHEEFATTVAATAGRPQVQLLVLRGEDRIWLTARGGRLGLTVTRLP